MTTGRQQLVLRHRHIVSAIVRDYVRKFPSMPRDELVAYGDLGLVEAASRYTPGAATFAHYAGIRIRSRVLDGVERFFGWNNRTQRSTVLLETEVTVPAEPELLLDVTRVLSTLTTIERQVVEEVLLHGRLLADVACDLVERRTGRVGCSRGRASQIYGSALSKLEMVYATRKVNAR